MINLIKKKLFSNNYLFIKKSLINWKLTLYKFSFCDISIALKNDFENKLFRLC